MVTLPGIGTIRPGTGDSDEVIRVEAGKTAEESDEPTPTTVIEAVETASPTSAQVEPVSSATFVSGGGTGGAIVISREERERQRIIDSQTQAPLSLVEGGTGFEPIRAPTPTISAQQLRLDTDQPTQVPASIQETQREQQRRAAVRAGIAQPFPTGTVGIAEEPGALERAQFRVATGQAGPLEATLVTGGSFVAGTAEGVFKGVKAVFTPKKTAEEFLELGKTVLKDVGSVFKGEGSEILSGFGETLKTNPALASQQLGELRGFGKGFGGTIKVAGRTFEVGRTVVDPRFTPIREGALEIGETRIEIAKGVESTAESLKVQAQRAGTEVTAVTAQRGLFGPLQKEITVGEFKEAKPLAEKIELEKSLFADPGGRLRISRLGLEAQKEATLTEVLSGEAKIQRAPQPQAIFFEKAQIEALPKDIKTALEQGKALTRAQEARLLQQQLKQTGQFKPVGFLSREAEITLAPGEIIRAKKTRAVTVIQGRRVPIIEGEVVKATPRTFELLEKQKQEGLSKTEFTELRERFKEETGTDIQSTPVQQTPLLRPSRFALEPVSFTEASRLVSNGGRVSSTIAQPSGITSAVPSSPSTSGFPSPGPVASPITGQPVSAPPSAPPSGPPSGPPSTPIIGRPPIRPFTPFAEPFTPPPAPRVIEKSKKPRVQGFNAFVKDQNNVFVKVNKVPLKRKDALARGAFVTDNTKAATFEIRPTSGAPKKPLSPTGVFQENQFREFRFKKGQKIKLQDRFIEKRKFRINTEGEKRDITVKGLLAKEKGKKKKKVKR